MRIWHRTSGSLALGAWLACVLGDATAGAAEPGVLALLAEGRIETRLRARGADRLIVDLTNRTEEPVKVFFEAPLVADGFAQNEVLAQFGQFGGPGAGGAQGLGLLESPSVELAAYESASLTIRTCCLNHGVPEPDARTFLFLKSASDYTPDRQVADLLAELAREGVPTAVAQAALWQTAQKIDWDRLARAPLDGGRHLQPEELRAARQWADQFAEPDDARPSAAPAVCVALNPDPRGAFGSAALVPQLARLLGARTGLWVHHANYTLPPMDPASTALQWSILLASPPPALDKLLGAVTVVESRWDPGVNRWRHQTPIVRRWIKGKTAQVEDGEPVDQLADLLAAELAQRAVRVRWLGRDRSWVEVANALPVAIRSVSLAGSDAEALASPSPLSLPAGSRARIALNADDARTLRGARILNPRRFVIDHP